MDKKRVALIDDHALVRIGIRTVLEAQRRLEYGFDVVVDEGDGLCGWEGIRLTQPDLILLDLNLPGLDGYEMLQRIGRMAVRPKVLILSNCVGNLPVRRALGAGANGFLYKTQDPDELLGAISTVFAGYCFVPRDTSGVLGRGAHEGVAALSPRERSVAASLVAGLSNKAIAHELCLSCKTVSAHKRNIFRKLSVGNLIQLADCLRFVDSYGVKGG